MTTHQNSTERPEPGRPLQGTRDGPDFVPRADPHHMPVGGWIREIATSENWRTSTIVQRHRDSAILIPSS